MTAVISTLSRQTLRDLVRPVEPVVSLYLDVRPPTPTLDIAEDLDLRWRAIAGELVAQGAAPTVVAAMARHLESAAALPSEVALFASAAGILLHQNMPTGVRFDQAHHGSPPRLLPLLSWLQRHPAHVVVVADRTGAELTVVEPGGVAVTTQTVVGPDDEIERNAPGGWAQPRYQRRAEDSWRHNAAAVAEATHQALRRASADLLLIAGDVRAVQLLEERLGDRLNRVRVRHVPGGRQPDGSAAARWAAVAKELGIHAAYTSSAVLRQFDAEHGPRGRAVDGVAATLAALAAGRVETLLVIDDPHDERRAWFGPDLLCVDDPSQTGRPAAQLQPGRMRDIAVRAALLTHAQIRVVDIGPAEGIGGLCRFS